MDFIHIYQSIWTVVVFALFFGIAAWAWSGKNKAAFDEAARIPLEDEKKLKDSALKSEQEETNG